MKHQKLVIALSLITLLTLTATIIYIYSQPQNPQNSQFQLNLTNLMALTDGQISFNVTLNKGESTTLNTITINGTQYLWSDGSQQDPNILQGQTKQWSKNVGNLQNGTSLQVTVNSTPTFAVANTTVKPSPSDQNEPTNQTNTEYIYNQYDGVTLFDEGIHIIATTKNPHIQIDQYPTPNNYWNLLKQNQTTTATQQDFINIILSRGDKPTSGYTINVQSFAWLESYPVKFRFQINVTDPDENIIVTQALTNPLVLIPIGQLTPGEYNIEVNVTWFIQSLDENDNTIYTPVMTFAPIIWKQTLTIHNTNEVDPQTTFYVIRNGAQNPNLTLQINLNDGLTQQEATRITDAAFNHTMGETTIRRLDTLDFDDHHITAHYTWGYDQNDLVHIFDLELDVDSLTITITHCR